MNKEKLFEAVVKFRIGSYPLQDINLMKDDWIVQLEEDILSNFDIDYQEYQDWKSGEEN